MPQLISAATTQGLWLSSFKWAYHAKVMNTLLQTSSAMEMTIGLKHRKPLPWDKLMPDQAFKIDFSEEGSGTAFSPADPKTIDEFMDRLTTEMRIVNLLKDGQKRTPMQLSKELGKSPNEIRQVLYRIMHRPSPKLVKIEDAYGLSYQGELLE